jgi:hypothetical protein
LRQFYGQSWYRKLDHGLFFWRGTARTHDQYDG